MSELSSSQTTIYGGGNYTTLKDFIDRKTVYPIPFVTTQVLSPSAVTFKLIASTILSGFIAKGTSSTTVNGGVVAAALAGAVGTGAITSISDSSGNILNLVEIRNATTNEEITDTDGRVVFGLIQCSNATADGAAIGGVGSENLQISFVKFDASDVLTLVSLTVSLEFQINKLYSQRYLPTLIKQGGVVDMPILAAQLINYTLQTSISPTDQIIALFDPTATKVASRISITDLIATAYGFKYGFQKTFVSAELSLTGTGNVTIAIGSTYFYADQLELIVSTLGGSVTLQPTISIGITGNTTRFINNLLTTNLDTLRKRETYNVATAASSNAGITGTNIVFTVNVAGAVSAGNYRAVLLVTGHYVDI